MIRSTRAFLLADLAMLLVAAGLHLAVVAGRAEAWAPMVHVVLFGWITGMIVAVSYHTMPVFAGRDWPYERLNEAHLALLVGGVGLAAAGLWAGSRAATMSGLVLQLLASLAFVANTILLFARGAPRPQGAPRSPLVGQREVDRVGTRATQVAALCLPVSIATALAVHLELAAPSWLLASQHLATLGWMMLMIVGVGLHILPRFAGRPVRGPREARAQLGLHVVALVVMVPALGAGWTIPFAVGSTLMMVALAAFAWTVWPTVRPFVAPPRVVSVDQLRGPRS